MWTIVLALVAWMASAHAQTSVYYDLYTGASNSVDDGAAPATPTGNTINTSDNSQFGDYVAVSSSALGSPTRTAIFTNSEPTWSNISAGGSSGAGVFTKMFGIADNTGSIRGFNERTSAGSNNPPSNGGSGNTANYDQNSGVGLPLTQIGNVAVVQPPAYITGGDGTDWYMELAYDGNENDNAISLDEFIVFTAPSYIGMSAAEEITLGANPTQADVIAFFEGKGATLLYSLDTLDSSGNVTVNNTILFNASGGGGSADGAFYIPVTDILADVNNLGYELYLWIEHGSLGNFDYNGDDDGKGASETENWGNSSGNEEWAYIKDGYAMTNVVPAPEPGSILAGGLIVAGSLGLLLRRRKREE